MTTTALSVYALIFLYIGKLGVQIMSKPRRNILEIELATTLFTFRTHENWKVTIMLVTLNSHL